MKSLFKYLLLSVAVLPLFSFAQKPSYQINGTINISSGTIYLKGFRNKNFFTIDSGRIAQGKFQLNGSVVHPDLYGITIDRDESFSPYYIFIENSSISVDIDTANHRTAKIAGSVSNDIFERYKANRHGFKIDSLIKAHPRSVVSAYILYRDFAGLLTPSEIEANIALLDPSSEGLSYIKELKEIIALRKNVAIGNPSIDFESQTPEGKNIKLSDYLGKYVLLDFWASWCPSCRRENPNLVRVYNKYQSKGFTIFAVSLDKVKENWINAISKDHLNWIHVSDLKFWDSAPAKLYAIRLIPSNVLIDPSGKIVAQNLKGEELDKKLSEIFSK